MHTRVVGQLLLTLVLLPRAAFSQAPAPIPSSAGGALAARKQARALAVDDGAIELDGRLSEEVWLKATAITDFTQKEPVEGGAPSDAMDVRFVYDSTAIYVGARMTARVERTIQAPLGLRDTSDQAEHILVSLDTFLDRRTAAVFGVSAAGVRIDRFHATDNEDSFDSGFDPVWQARTSVDDDGWTAELWIPFSQLRFNPRAEQVWGLNVQRFRPTNNEEDYWIVIPRTERAWASRFGELRGIENVQPSRRIELLPYVAGSSAITPSSGDGNPFDEGGNLGWRAGGDLKMGLGPNLTLEATFNPDFGQVEADPAEVNLTAFETRFPEKRPFFLEGASLFNIGHPNFYYSRRIGARPIGPATADYVDYPSASTIIGAAKLTGRLPSKTSIGFLTAVTAEESADLASIGVPGIRELTVAPRAFHTVGRVLQEFGPLGSTAGAFVSAVHRDLDPNDPLASLLTQKRVRRCRQHDAALQGRRIRAPRAGRLVVHQRRARGDRAGAAVERALRAASRSRVFSARPDADVAGRLVAAGGLRSPERAPLALGDEHQDRLREFRDQRLRQPERCRRPVDQRQPPLPRNPPRPGVPQLLDRCQCVERLDAALAPAGGLVARQCRSDVGELLDDVVLGDRNLPQMSASLTRGGPLMARAPDWTLSFGAGNRSTSPTRVTTNATITNAEDGRHLRRVSGTFSFRPGPRWRLSAEPSYEQQVESQQYVSTLTGGPTATFGGRYIFAAIDRSTAAVRFRLGLTIKPDMNLDVYAEPFAASGRYADYGELLAARTATRLTYGEPGTTLVLNPDGSRSVRVGEATFTLRNRDFNTQSFRSNVVLRWEWRVGSTLYVVWQQDRSASDPIGSRIGFGDAFRAIAQPGTNVFVIKTSFWLPVK